MIEITEALSEILKRAAPRAPIQRPVCEALGLVLAEDIASDIDSPPYDKALMDGYAVIASDVSGGSAELKLLEEITAGDVPTQTVTAGWATRIMTGAPMPPGADAVVMQENTELDRRPSPPIVHIREARVESGQNMLPRAASLRRGDIVLRAGRTLAPPDIGVLSEVGRDRVRVHASPTVAVVATGNELVRPDQVPGPGQIRNSNGPMLCALVSGAGAKAVDLGIARDDRAELARSIRRGLEEDVLILSGGVSMGVLDLVPAVLQEAGVEPVFHKVRLKPGKPMWFGVALASEGNRLVFGLPGNPVSSLVCFEVFVRPALAVLAGRPAHESPRVIARLARRHHQRGDRPTYYPARLRDEAGAIVVEPLAWRGSADLTTLAQADGLALFPAGRACFEAGETVTVMLLRSRVPGGGAGET